MVIKFSNKPPSSWNAVTFPGGTVATWLTDHMKAANCAVKKKGLVPFAPVAFKVADLIKVVNQDNCAYIVFSHFLVPNKIPGGAPHSSLLAYGANSADDVLARDKDCFFVGTPPKPLDFKGLKVDNANIELINSCGYTWDIKKAENAQIPLSDWVMQPNTNGRFQKGIDFLIRARILRDEANAFLTQFKPDGIIAFYPGVYLCNIENDPSCPPDNEERTGDFCTLLLCGDAGKGSFKVCTDAWRPNWPRGGTPIVVNC